MVMDIYGKARELGYSIASSAQMTRLKDSEAALEADENAKNLMNEYIKVQTEALKALKNKESTEALESYRSIFEKKKAEVNENKITKEFIDAKADFDSFMKEINDVIIFSITGEESCSSGKCGSCSGCGDH